MTSIVDKTVFVLVTDNAYFPKAKTTIRDLRSIGQWQGDVVLIAIDFDVNQNFLDFYSVQQKRFAQIQEKTDLCKLLNYSPFLDTIDSREISKLNQWEKLHVFDPFFKQWDRVVFVDAGVRILLTASEEVRLQRRSAEKTESTENLKARDASDSKVVEFMAPAEGVKLIDTSHLSFEESVETVIAEIERSRA